MAVGKRFDIGLPREVAQPCRRLRAPQEVRWVVHRRRKARPAETTISFIELDYGRALSSNCRCPGYRTLLRFAVEYKALFGEAPSATLARVE